MEMIINVPGGPTPEEITNLPHKYMKMGRMGSKPPDCQHTELGRSSKSADAAYLADPGSSTSKSHATL